MNTVKKNMYMEGVDICAWFYERATTMGKKIEEVK
jgi:hypothetical protein